MAMDDTISRAAAIDALNKMKIYRPLDSDRYVISDCLNKIVNLPSAQPTGTNTVQVEDCISRAAVVDAIEGVDWYHINRNGEMVHGANSAEHQAWYKADDIYKAIERVPSAQPDLGKYEYHYDHTDCIWYQSEARNRCPATCAQYRDGWNDAMNYIFRDGEGYRPFRRDKKYEG